ncbi:MAG: tetratricopeptide repeat-containing sensor histidine kinase [Bacteroidaceae bacterium]|nr:tetratricopeptide repeat-containing sensor histidine kinase [Bacteroidaceae bacterium]
MERYRRILFLLLTMLSVGMAASADTVEDRYWQLQREFSYETAGLLLKQLETEGITKCQDLDIRDEEQAQGVVDAAMSDYYFGKDNKKSLAYTEKALEAGRKCENERLVEVALCQKSSLYVEMGEYDKSMEAAVEALTLAEKLRDIEMQTFCNIILAKLYSYNNNPDVASKCLEKALVTARSDYDRADCYGMIGEVLSYKGKYEEALRSIQKAVDIAQKAGDEENVMHHIWQKAMVFAAQRRYDEAEAEYRRIIPFYEKNDETKYLARVYSDLCDMYIEKENYAGAVSYGEMALHLWKKVGDRYQTMQCFQSLSKAYRWTNLKNAYVYRLKYDSLKELIYSDKQNDLLVKYETAEKERVIEKQQSEIYEQITDRQSKMKMFGVLATVLILAIVLFFAVRSAKINQRHATQLKLERDEATAARAEAERARDDAVKANKLKEVFIDNVVHELRTPINAIQGFNQLLTDQTCPPSPDESMEYMRYITENCNKLIKLVQDTLDVSLMESGNYPVSIASMSVKDVCLATLKKFSDSVKPGVKLQVADGEDFAVMSDRLLVERLIANYLSNACKYTSEGSITLAFSKMGNISWQVSVTDTGTGIAPENADKVFNCYEKLGSYVPGNGIGLALVRVIVKLLHGHAYMDTGYTDGCRFVARFDSK